MIEKKIQTLKEINTLLVGWLPQGKPESYIMEYLDELSFLASTAGAIEVKRVYQKLDKPDSRTFLGKGKIEEIRDYIQKNMVDLVIFDEELSGSQINIIEDIIKRKVIDRSDLILDIFATRAKTAIAKVQVELAQYQYLLPRLKGMWKHLERQGGGIGSRGPGETEIETDRRLVKDKISLLRKKLSAFEKQAQTQRKERGELIRVSLVGYTNVGKSTLMNVLSKSDVFAENKLFATLDTTTRKLVWDRSPFLLSDTVGFIRKLPHHLVKSFKSTLDEAVEADILLHVVDISHPLYEEQINVVKNTLQELGCGDKKTIMVYNKMDKYISQAFDERLEPEVKEELLQQLKNNCITTTQCDCAFISATQKEHIEELRTIILNAVREMYGIRYPYKTVF